MRLNYSEEEDFPGQFEIWQANCRRSMRGKKGQAALRRLEAALVAMPDKALRMGKLVAHDGSVCAIGALARAEGKLPEPEPIEDDWEDEDTDDTADTAEWATDHLDVPKLVAWKVVEQNDIQFNMVWERHHGPVRLGYGHYQGGVPFIRDMTPEERYERMLAWVRSHLVGDTEE